MLLGEAPEQFTMIADELIESRLEGGGGLLVLALLQKRDELPYCGLLLGRKFGNNLCETPGFHAAPVIQGIFQRIISRNSAKGTADPQPLLAASPVRMLLLQEG